MTSRRAREIARVFTVKYDYLGALVTDPWMKGLLGCGAALAEVKPGDCDTLKYSCRDLGLQTQRAGQSDEQLATCEPARLPLISAEIPASLEKKHSAVSEYHRLSRAVISIWPWLSNSVSKKVK